MNLRQQLANWLRGRICIVGLGNPDYGDDGLGVRLAERLIAAGVPNVFLAGTSPDRIIGEIAAAVFDKVLFLDAVEFGGPAGAVAMLNSAEMIARYPQISTHKISIGTLARLLEANGTTKVWLLAVQPESMKPESQLAPAAQTTLEIVSDLIISAMDLRAEPAGVNKG
jgi:hydrogenase maturation protease